MAFFAIVSGWLVLYGIAASVTVTLADVSACAPKPSAAAVIRALAWLTGLCGNLAVFVLLHMMFYNRWNFLDSVQSIVRRQMSYQKIGFLFWILLVWLGIALLLGFAVRAALSSKGHWEHADLPASARRRKKAVLALDLSAAALALMALGSVWLGGTRHIRINEICAKNLHETFPDGYIELRNDGNFPCEFSELYLSDSETNRRKLAVPAARLDAGELLCVPFGDSALSVSKSGGTTIVLSDSWGSVMDKVVIGQSRKGAQSYSRSAADQTWRYMTPSPGQSNDDVGEKAAAPRLSAAPGYYASAFDVTILAADGEEDAQIHYTTDGSTPTAESPLYTGAVHVYDRSAEPNRWRAVQNIVYDWQDAPVSDAPVKKAFVLRAVSVDANGAVSSEATASYFVGSRFDTERMVVSVVADENDLFGPDGIYVTGQTYDDWYLGGGKGERPTANFDVHGTERPAHIEFFQDGKTLYFAQRGGLRIQGGSTRWLPLKRFSLFARKAYAGSSTFDKQLFADKNTHSVTLRDGFCNAFSMVTVPDRDVAVQRSVPVTVYLNGEYWYDTYMQEKYNDTFFRQTYGVRNVEFYKTGITEEIKTFLAGHDLSVTADYEAFGQMIDIQSYIDYICTNVYLANTDYSEYGNTAMWRTVTRENDGFGDHRWRWCLYDMDLQTAGCRMNYGMTDITDAQMDSFNIVCDWDPPVNRRLIYADLKVNADFRRQFVLSFMDMMNTDFTVERMSALLAEWGEDISYDDYFFRDRGPNMIVYLAKEFGLKGTVENLTVTVSDEAAGYVTVNTARPTLSEGSWTGQYFTDYPVTVTAHPNPGYRFAGWTGSSESQSETIELSVNGGVTVNAVFEKE